MSTTTDPKELLHKRLRALHGKRVGLSIQSAIADWIMDGYDPEDFPWSLRHATTLTLVGVDAYGERITFRQDWSRTSADVLEIARAAGWRKFGIYGVDDREGTMTVALYRT